MASKVASGPRVVVSDGASDGGKEQGGVDSIVVGGSAPSPGSVGAPPGGVGQDGVGQLLPGGGGLGGGVGGGADGP